MQGAVRLFSLPTAIPARRRSTLLDSGVSALQKGVCSGPKHGCARFADALHPGEYVPRRARDALLPLEESGGQPASAREGSPQKHQHIEMSNPNTRSPARRTGRGPRRNRERDDSYEPRSQREPRAAAPLPEKKGLFHKILGFFSPKKPAANGSARPPQSRPASATTTSSYPGRTVSPRPTRKPEAVEVTSAKLYVGNLSFDATESDLSELFNGVGAVSLAEVVTNNHTTKSKGFGFVTMSSIDEAKRAVEVLHDKEFMGRKLVVSGAKTPVDRR